MVTAVTNLIDSGQTAITARISGKILVEINVSSKCAINVLSNCVIK